MIKKIVLGCCFIISLANASNSNVATLTDVKEALHFLLKDYKEQEKKMSLLETKVSELENKTKVISKDTQNINKKSSLSFSNESSNDDKLILDYLKEKK